MSGSLIKEYLIGFGFQMDEAGAESARNALTEILDAAKALEAQAQSASASLRKALSSIEGPLPLKLSIDGLSADISAFAVEALSAISAIRDAQPIALSVELPGQDVAKFAREALSALSALRDSPPIGLSIDTPDGDVYDFVERARSALEGLSINIDTSGVATALVSAEGRLSGFLKTARSALIGLNLNLSVDTGGLNGAAQAASRASRTIRSEMEAARKSVRSVPAEGRSFSSLSGSAISAFRSVSASAQSQMKSAAATVSAYVQQMKSALSRLSTAMSNSGGSGPKFSVGGVVDKETQATIGEDGREYVIPVTKPDRAVPLIKAAMKDLNMDGSAALSAIKQLGGSATANRQPDYVNARTGNSETVNNSVVNHNVSAPATINVYGKDAESVAKNVERNQEMLLIRNIKGVYA